MARTTTSLYLSDNMVADRLAVSRGTVWRWCRNGTFPQPVKFGSGSTRWRLSDVEAWEAESVT